MYVYIYSSMLALRILTYSSWRPRQAFWKTRLDFGEYSKCTALRIFDTVLYPVINVLINNYFLKCFSQTIPTQ